MLNIYLRAPRADANLVKTSDSDRRRLFFFLSLPPPPLFFFFRRLKCDS